MTPKPQKKTKSPSIQFKKSSFSPVSQNCVGVCISLDRVLVTNTKLKRRKIIEFNEHEWRAFILGVKNGEFDL
jgi:hypothetical protein